ncbi:MAG: ROK family protein [Phycisphaerales bacterium]|jgi:predicted NBD/HSP70 family sugar kinase|nr:ROK family protein [Phycisphaerales bacterium]
MLTGVDLGGTKIEAAVLGDDGAVLARHRVPTPKGQYDATIEAVAAAVRVAETQAGGGGPHIGMGVPGSPSPRSGLMRNCNSTVLNGRPLAADLRAATGREIRMANDANCLALSEATDGAAAGVTCVFAVILGTGVGGGIVIDGRLLEGANGIGGEWGHIPLPWPTEQERSARTCWCGRTDCLETWLSGPAIESEWAGEGRPPLPATTIASAHADADVPRRWVDRLARATAVVIDLIDPDVIVVGGGLNAIEAIYTEVPKLWPGLVFSDAVDTRIVPAMHGDASGVRGAARLPARYSS